MFAGDWQVKMGASVLAPQNDDNGTIANTTATVSNEIGFTPSVEYFFADSPFSVELLLATPFKHDVILENVGKPVLNIYHQRLLQNIISRMPAVLHLMLASVPQ